MKAYGRICLALTMLLCAIHKVSSINCYYCNSANNSACYDVNKLDEETRARMIPTVNCELTVPSAVAPDFFCRKIIQTIFHPQRDSEVRVTRACGWVRHEKDCYKADSSDHLETACQCFTDHCNAADSPNLASITLFFILAACLYYYR